MSRQALCDLAKISLLRELVENKLGIPVEMARTTFVNGVARNGDYVLEDGDQIGIFPIAGGGQHEGG